MALRRWLRDMWWKVRRAKKVDLTPDPVGDIQLVLTHGAVDPNAVDDEAVGTLTVVPSTVATIVSLSGNSVPPPAALDVDWTSGLTATVRRTASGTLTAGGTVTLNVGTRDSQDRAYEKSFTIPIATVPTDITLTPDTIAANASAGTQVGLLTTTNGVAPYTYSGNTNTDFTVSAAGAVTRSATGTISAGTETLTGLRTTDLNGNTFDENVTITVSDPPGTPSEITSFTVENWNTATSTGFLLFGLPFRRGDIPTGFIPEIRLTGTPLTGVQFDERTTWDDGSLKFAACCMRDTDFSASESRTYTVHSVSGSFSNTGTKSLSDITGSTDFKTLFTSMTQWNGSTSVQRDSGAKTESFNTSCATSTRVWKYLIGGVCEAWEVWGPAVDNTSGVGDTHLVVEGYAYIWKNSNDTIAAYEYVAVSSQYWWSAASKFRLDYSAELRNGVGSLQAYSGVQHPYRSQWATVRMTDDHNYAKPHWIEVTKSIPTLTYKPNKSYWVQTGLVPPLDRTFAPTGDLYAQPYVPCQNMGHRAAVDGTGSYAGRAPITNPDATAFMKQTALGYRRARVQALAGLSVPYHYRSNRVRQRPASAGCPGGDSTADTAATIISLRMDPLSAAQCDFTADGMPLAVYAYSDSSVSASFKDGYVVPTGGTGVWTNPTFSAHAVSYSYFMYLHEPRRYLMKATLDLAMKTATTCTAAQGMPNLPNYVSPVYQTALSIPATPTYTAIAEFGSTANIRHMGWVLNLLGHGYAILPDNDPQRGFYEAFHDHNLDYTALYLTYIGSSQTDAGTLFRSSPDAPYHTGFCGYGAFSNYGCTRNADALSLGNFFVKGAIGMCSTHRYRMMYEQMGTLPKTTGLNSGWDPGVNEWRAPADWPIHRCNVNVNPSTDIVTFTSRVGSDLALTANDKVWFVRHNNNDVDPVPTEFPEGTTLYMRQITGSGGTESFKVSTTPDDNNIVNFTNTYTGYHVDYYPDTADDYPVALSSVFLPNTADSFGPHLHALLHYAAFWGNASAQAELADADMFFQNISYQSFCANMLRV